MIDDAFTAFLVAELTHKYGIICNIICNIDCYIHTYITLMTWPRHTLSTVSTCISQMTYTTQKKAWSSALTSNDWITVD